MITEIRNEDYELITYKDFIELLSYNYEYIHIVNKDDFLYIEVKRASLSLPIGISIDGLINVQTIYNYSHYKVENK